MRKIEDTTKQLKDENNSIEKRYRTTICNDYGLKPATYFTVKGLPFAKVNSDHTYTDSYVCISCKNRYYGLSAFGLEPQGIVEVYKLM